MASPTLWLLTRPRLKIPASASPPRSSHCILQMLRGVLGGTPLKFGLVSERVFHTHRDTHQRSACPAVWIRKGPARRVRSVVAVRGDAAPASTQVIMRVLVVKSAGPVHIPKQGGRDRMLVGGRQHVRRITRVRSAWSIMLSWITWCSEGVRPAK